MRCCTEVNCNNDLSTVQGMRNVTDLYDGTRPITMNHLIEQPAEAYLDIQGMSHRAGAHQDSWHQANPKKPGFASEVRTLIVVKLFCTYVVKLHTCCGMRVAGCHLLLRARCGH